MHMPGASCLIAWCSASIAATTDAFVGGFAIATAAPPSAPTAAHATSTSNRPPNVMARTYRAVLTVA
jgi:hypothetical protein